VSTGEAVTSWPVSPNLSPSPDRFGRNKGFGGHPARRSPAALRSELDQR
jgi:hypothetical protein